MIINYLKIGVRNFLKNSVSATINLMGLTIGIMACILILQYVFYERSFDDFHQQGDQIYRVALLEKQGNSEDRSASNYYGVVETISEELPEINSFCTLHAGSGLMTYRHHSYQEEKIYHVNPNFLDFFSYPLIKGNRNTALREINNILVTPEAALKYFGSDDPMEKILFLNNERFVVSGVIQSPKNSHFTFDFIINNQDLVENQYRKNDAIWNWSNFYCYILLEPHVNAAVLESKFPNIVDQHLDPNFDMSWQHPLQPLRDIHLNSNLDWELGPTGHGPIISTLVIIALLILVIAWVNFVNLSTAQSTRRAKEVGIRKVSGARRTQLVVQFLVQAAILNFSAFFLAILGCTLVEPLFVTLLGTPIQSSWVLILQNGTLFFLFFVFGILAAGLYPAVIMSGFRPARVLKGKFGTSTSGLGLRKALTLFQFTASIVLIVGTFMIYKQLQFMRNQELGFSADQILVMTGPTQVDSTFKTRFESFKNELKSLAGIEYVSSSTTVPSRSISGIWSGFRRAELDTKEGILMEVLGTDEAFIPTYQIDLLAGKNFDPNLKLQRQSVLINESAVHALGFQNSEAAVDQMIALGDNPDNVYQVSGVMTDYHQKSLKEKVDPVCMFFWPGTKNYFSIKINASRVESQVSAINSTYAKLFPGNPFEFFYLDEAFERLYDEDRRLGKIITFFSALAIFIACLGLFGLTTFTILNKAKEIGIRKVLGATSLQILNLLSKEFVGIVTLAMVIALPLSIYLVNQWLSSYPYQTQFEWWVFAASALIVLLLAISTVSLQGLKAALTNPVKTLRDE